MINRLHKGRSDEFVALIDRYFEQGMARLADNHQQVKPVAEQLLAVLNDDSGQQAVVSLVNTWDSLAPLEKAYAAHPHPNPLPEGEGAAINKINKDQQNLLAKFTPFFKQLHDCLKQIDKAVRRHEKTLAEAAQQAGKRQSADRATRQLKAALEELHKEVKNAGSSFGHIQ